jgi:hypothetical protein
MKKVDHLNSEIIDHVCNSLWDIEGSLNGIGALMEQQTSDPYYKNEEIYGIGQLLKRIAREISSLEDILRSRDVPR